MPRQPRRRPESEHYTSARLHQLRRQVGMRKKIAGKPLAAELLRLGRHLCLGCETCWHTVDHLRAMGFRLCDPVTDAIARITDPRSWYILREKHREALRKVRERPYGFAYVVLNEATTHVTARYIAGTASPPAHGAPPDLRQQIPEFHYWVGQLLEGLGAFAEPGSPELTDLEIYKLCLQAEMSMNTTEAMKCLANIHAALPGSTRQPHVLYEVHEIEIVLYAEAGRFREATESYEKALELLGSDQGLHRFDLRANIGTTLLFQRGASAEALYQEFAAALTELPQDRPEPRELFFMAWDLAEATRRLAGAAFAKGLENWPGIEYSLAALEQAEPLFRQYGDLVLFERAKRCRADLKVLATRLGPGNFHPAPSWTPH